MTGVTIFSDSYNTTNPFYISLDDALDRIRNGDSKDTVEKIRKAKTEGKAYDGLKKKLPSVIFAGECRKSFDKVYKTGKKKGQPYKSFREDESVTAHSGFFVLDFDGIKTKAELDAKKSVLFNDKYIYSYWESPSSVEGGYGIKALVRCPPNTINHSKYYESFLLRYPELDSTSRNLSRLCFESYDVDLHVNRRSAIWNKIVEKPKQEVTEPESFTDYNKISIAVNMIRTAPDGSKHKVLISAARLLGGYIGIGRVAEDIAIKTLEDEIQKRDIDDFEGAQKAILDGIEYGKAAPIHETKRTERNFKKKQEEGGAFNFLASDDEMEDYLGKYLDGTLEMGKTTGIPALDNHFMIKKNQLDIFGGFDNTGKSLLVWYLSVLAVLYNDMKVAVYAAENRDPQVKRKFMELIMNKPYSEMNDSERKEAHEIFNKNFRIISSARDVYTATDIIEIAETLYETEFEFDILVIDPYNSLSKPSDVSGYDNSYLSLSKFRLFTQNYAAIWLTAHAITSAARTKDEQGYVERPHKSALEGGQPFANRADDMVMLHRLINHENAYRDMQFHVDKVKDTESGGRPTSKEKPLILTLNDDAAGYTCHGYDPVRSYWLEKRSSAINEEGGIAIQPNINFSSEAPF